MPTNTIKTLKAPHLHCSCYALMLCLALACPLLRGGPQAGSEVNKNPDQTWAGRRIVSLHGFGDYFVLDSQGKPVVVKPDGLGVNIVAVVDRAEAERIWLKANGAGESSVGWIDKKDAILLEDAIPYFTSLIQRDPGNWDFYLRRAEAEHAQNQRDAAIKDYSLAIEHNPSEPFLYLRRGRSFRTLNKCDKAVADFATVSKLRANWPEAYNLQAGVYSDCSDTRFRDPEKAIALIQHAIALDMEHPTYLTVLAVSYFRSGQLEEAVASQKQALESPKFPPGYREEASLQLQRYEQALAARKFVKQATK